MTPKRRVGRGQKTRERHVSASVEVPEVQQRGNPVTGISQESLEDLVAAMGKRLQAEYIEGAIPYLREYETELWAQLEALDREESLEALLAYEHLFFEGIRRYLSHLEAGRQAA